MANGTVDVRGAGMTRRREAECVTRQTEFFGNIVDVEILVTSIAASRFIAVYALASHRDEKSHV